MASTVVRETLAIRALSARYSLFVGLGAVLSVVGLILLGISLTGAQADRAWHLFHVNWVFFTSLTGGSMAFVAVQKVTKAKWSGLMIRFSEAAAFLFFPVSLIGFLLIFTVGYSHIFPAMQGLGHGERALAIAQLHVLAALHRPLPALLSGLSADPRGPDTRHVRDQGPAHRSASHDVRSLDRGL